MLSSQRKISDIQRRQIELADKAGVQQRKSFNLMSKEIGGRTNLGFTRLDQKNYLRGKRERSLLQGDADYLLQYFQRKSVENPSFYHAYQLDIEDQITNIFWADARMIIDYGYFGDVVSLDSTYCTNESHRPLAIISGFNHHRVFKNYMNRNLDIIKFFERFEDVVEEKQYKELKCEFETRQKIPRLKNSYSDILQQMSELYTPTIFDLFQEQYELFEACIVKSMNIQTSSINYVIAMKKDLGEWQVDYDLEKKSICCSCRKFESFGILCCHCLKVFIHMDVTSVPESYILKRWTKIARSGDLQTIGVSGVAEDLDLSPTQRYQKICPRYIRIITEGCRSSEAFMFLNEVADDLDEQMLKFQNMQISNDQMNETSNKVKEVTSTNDGSTQVTRLAQKEGRRGSKRWKGWVQSKLAKRKKHSESNASQIKEPVVYFVLNI
jgi:hypothetical protein